MSPFFHKHTSLMSIRNLTYELLIFFWFDSIFLHTMIPLHDDSWTSKDTYPARKKCTGTEVQNWYRVDWLSTTLVQCKDCGADVNIFLKTTKYTNPHATMSYHMTCSQTHIGRHIIQSCHEITNHWGGTYTVTKSIRKRKKLALRFQNKKRKWNGKIQKSHLRF